MKEFIIRLAYVEMLGHDASFGYIHAVKMAHDDSIALKRTGYLAVTLFLNEDHDLIILIVNTIQKDLKSDNYLVVSAALNAACRLINEETIPAVLPQVVGLIRHPKESVRKKAIMALHRFYQRSPASVFHLVSNFRKRLSDNDPGVISAALCPLFDLITVDPNSYKDLVISFVSILKQVAERRLPKSYDYHQMPAPFIQIKLLKILALLGRVDKRASGHMYTVVGDIVRRCDQLSNIGNAVLYESVCCVAAIYPNSKLLGAAADAISRFLKSDSHNLKYMGIDALGRLIRINPEVAEQHQLAVIDCLEDPDDTLKRKTFELLYKMTTSSNVEVIVDQMIGYMININDSHNKTEIASHCVELAEQFAPSNQWFIQTMNKVFEHAGNLVNIKVAHNLMRLIAEGFRKDDDTADSLLKLSAVESYLHIVGEPKLSPVFLQVICWVLGEYGTADGKYSATYITGKLCDVAEAYSSNDTVKAYAITAIVKIMAFELAAGRKCQSLIEELKASHSTDLQQRAYEIQALISLDSHAARSIMPLDASCEDIEVDAVLDKDKFTLEELLEEEEIIQECKALNSRLINFLRDRTQVDQLLRYIIEDPSEDADSRRTFRFPFVACEVFACEIDVILRTLVEEEELMDLLFSFLDPNRPHSPLLAGYFSKVVVSLMLRKTVPLMNYVETHQDIIRQLVDLIGITSIMEVLVRLVGADDHAYPSYLDVIQWLSDSNLLEMIVDKLSPSSSPEVQANAAETLCAITRNVGSSLATKLSSPSFVSRILGLAVEDSHSRSGLVHSLSVCISLLDPRKSFSSWIHSVRGQHIYEAPVAVNVDTVDAMLPKLGDLLLLLNVSTDDKVLPMPYGELRPPLGKHRLKIVEFIAVLLKAGNVAAEEELVKSGTIKRVLDLLFEYPYNNALHHHAESIVLSCMESKNDNVIDHLFKECDLISKILQADTHPVLSCNLTQPTTPASGKKLPRAGNLGHITRISNRIFQLGQNNGLIRSYLQENGEWNEWQTTVLQERNRVWNVYRWDCGRPTALLDRTRDSDNDILHSRDYDIPALSNNLSQNNGTMERDDEGVYFDDDSAEVVISSLRLGDDQGSLFTNSNWFTFRDESIDDTSDLFDKMDEISLSDNKTLSGDHSSSSDDEVVVDEDEEELVKNNDHNSTIQNSSSSSKKMNIDSGVGPTPIEKADRSTPNPFISSSSAENGTPDPESNEATAAHVDNCSKIVATVTSLFEEDVEFVGVEPEGTEKAMDQALKEGIVGEAVPMKRNRNGSVDENTPTDDSSVGMKEFNDANYWRVEQEVAVIE